MKPVGKAKRFPGEAAITEGKRSEAERAQVEHAAEVVSSPLTVKIDTQLFFERNELKITVHHRLHYSTGPVEHTTEGRTDIPANYFKDDETFQMFVARVTALYTNPLTERLTAALADEAALTLGDIIYFVLNDLEIDSSDMRDLAKYHAQQTQKRVARHLAVPQRGRGAQWKRAELARAILAELRALSKRDRTYSRVASALEKKYGTKAPVSGDGLRKMLERLELDWSDLKNGSL